MALRPIQQFVKGQTIITEGSQGDRSFKILQGEVMICKHNEGGGLVPIAKLGQDEIFGEMYLFDLEKERSATVIAVSSEVILEIYSQAELLKMLEVLSVSSKHIFEGLSQRLKKTSHSYVALTEHQKTSVPLPNAPIQDSKVITQHNTIKLKKPEA
jgi:CRP-like cAMP-binding protein